MRYLNAVGGGRIVRIEGNIAVVDDDGFETPVLLRECVAVSTDQNTRMGAAIETPQPSKQAQPAQAQTTHTTQPAIPSEAAIETPGGDNLNIVLGWEAGDLRHIGASGYDCYLINDSNFYLDFVLMAQRDGEDVWNTIYAGTVEPNIQLLIGEHTSEDVSVLDNIRFQALAYKQGRTFRPKTPLDVCINVDTTKFSRYIASDPTSTSTLRYWQQRWSPMMFRQTMPPNVPTIQPRHCGAPSRTKTCRPPSGAPASDSSNGR